MTGCFSKNWRRESSSSTAAGYTTGPATIRRFSSAAMKSCMPRPGSKSCLTKGWRKKKCGSAKGIEARRTRNEGRVRALKAMREQRSKRRERLGTARITTQEAERSGTLVIEAKGVSFGYGGAPGNP